MAESTTTDALDALIAARPQRLEYFRTRGIVYCFREDYAKAVRDFTHALKESRAARKARHPHVGAPEAEHRAKGKRGKRTHGSAKKTNAQAPPDGTSAPDPHPSVLPDAPEPIEPQMLFLRGSAYLQHAVHLIERTLLDIEQVRKPGLGDGAADMRLSYIENGRYGGLEIGHPDGPLGARDGEKRRVYLERMGGDAALRDNVDTLARKAIRDTERFLAHFDTMLAAAAAASDSDSLALVSRSSVAADTNGASAAFSTYHPLLVDAHFSVLIALLLLGDFVALLPALTRAVSLVEGLEGYPVFLPARSMAQSELLETLDRLADGWANGTAPEGVATPPPPRTPLEYARALLRAAALRRPADQGKGEENGKGAKRTSLNFPMHGPRVEVVLAWLGAVHLPALDAEAEVQAAGNGGPDVDDDC